MKVITKAVINWRDEPEAAEVFRDLHVYTKDDSIASHSEDASEITVWAEFEHTIDELVADLQEIENGGDASTWFNVDDEFSMEDLLLAKREMEKMRGHDLGCIEVFNA